MEAKHQGMHEAVTQISTEAYSMTMHRCSWKCSMRAGTNGEPLSFANIAASRCIQMPADDIAGMRRDEV